MDFIKLQRRLVNLLTRIPTLHTFSGRDSLLQGLPYVSLSRSENDALLDLNNIISGLNRLGRLTKEGGTRPVIVVVENALSYVPDGGEIADELQEVYRQLEEYYGGDVQPQPVQPVINKTYEALIFGEQRDTRLQFSFIQQAQIAASSIARLTVSRIFNWCSGRH